MLKKIICAALIAVMTFGLCACRNDDVTDQVMNAAQAADPNVQMVKTGSPEKYPNKTYGKAFDSFFKSPAWKYFTSDDKKDVVEFTGYCLYQDTEVKALIQFILDKKNNTFEATYLSFNDVPQSYMMLSALIEKAFTE